MRINGGFAGGRKLVSPKNDAIRPTSDRVREAIFNILGVSEFGNVLDLFAGTGAFGLEAISRGADFVLFIDSNKAALDLVRQNAEALKMTDKAEIRKMDAKRALGFFKKRELKFDLVFLDPPYGKQILDSILELDWNEVLEKDAIIIAECSVYDDFQPDSEKWLIYDERKYGDTMLKFLELNRN